MVASIPVASLVAVVAAAVVVGVITFDLNYLVVTYLIDML
jgi:hypothetical protein